MRPDSRPRSSLVRAVKTTRPSDLTTPAQELAALLAEYVALPRLRLARGRPDARFRRRFVDQLRKCRLFRERLTATKVFHRAVDWTVTSERVSWSIQRHPLGVVLRQVWAFDLASLQLTKIHEEFLALQHWS